MVDGDQASQEQLVRRAGEGPGDWERVLGGVREALTRLSVHPLVVEDPEAKAILDSMVFAADMEELDNLVDRLGDRLRAVMAERGLRRPKLHADAATDDIKSVLAEALGEAPAARGRRTMLRL